MNTWRFILEKRRELIGSVFHSRLVLWLFTFLWLDIFGRDINLYLIKIVRVERKSVCLKDSVDWPRILKILSIAEFSFSVKLWLIPVNCDPYIPCQYICNAIIICIGRCCVSCVLTGCRRPQVSARQLQRSFFLIGPLHQEVFTTIKATRSSLS